jgi:AcrR family transcriptional regulator
MRSDARRNYARLVAAAREAFTERGADASLDDVAKRAGVGPGTLYRHFPTREALLAAVYRNDVEGLAGQADELSKTLPPEEALTEYLRLHVSYITQMSGLGAAVKAMLAADSATVDFCRESLRAALRRLLEPAQAAGVIRSDVEAPDVLRLMHGIGKACETAPDQAERLLSFVLDGLRPPAN